MSETYLDPMPALHLLCHLQVMTILHDDVFYFFLSYTK
jgi:hypothetical protein